MARIVVVSESSALSLALATSDHDIAEVAAEDAESADVDLFVVDLDEPIDAVAFLGDLRADGTATPAVVVIGDTPEWHSVQSLDSSAIAIVERPVSRPSLLAAVEHLLGDPAEAPEAEARPVGLHLPPQPLPVEQQLSSALQKAEAAGNPATARDSSASPTARPRPTKPAKTPRVRGRRRAEDPQTPPAPLRPARRSFAEAADEVIHEARRLQGLDIVACDTVGRAMAAVDGTAGALIVRDAEVWRTAGGLALRPREWIVELHADSWLIDLVAQQQRAIIVEDTDIARQRLVNVPLSRCRNLLAVPVAAIQGALLVARDDEPFDTDDLETVVATAREAEADLITAVLLRDVADTLQRFSERRS